MASPSRHRIPVLRQRSCYRSTRATTLLMPPIRGVVIQLLEMTMIRHLMLPQMPTVILPLEQ